MTQAILGAVLLATAGCAATQSGDKAMAESAACTIEGKELPDLSHDAICAAVREGFVAAGGDAAMPIALRVVSDSSVEGSVIASPDSTLADLTFDVMDARMSADMLRGFGRDLANMAARNGGTGQ